MSIYEIIMIILACISISTIFIDNNPILSIIDNIIVVIFIMDYVGRFILAKNKKVFFKNNIIDLISSLPFNALFKGLRIFKIFRFLKFTKMAKFIKLSALITRLIKKSQPFLKTNNFINVLYFTVSTMAVGTIGIHYIEKMDWENSIWWTVVTLTTVGYGDVSPKTTIGKFLAIIIMFVGISFLSMLTGTIATYFLNSKKNESNNKFENKTIDISHLDENQSKKVLEYVDMISNYSSIK
jgi:voltage-gated potassium channel